MANNKHPDQQIESWQTVEVTTLDAAARELGIKRVDFVKIDVEGAEKLVFEGARETLAAHPSAVILFESAEFAASAFAYTTRGMLSELQTSGFSLYYFDGPERIQFQTPGDPRIGREIYNFVAYRREPQSR